MPTLVFGDSFVCRAHMRADPELADNLGDVGDQPREQQAAHFYDYLHLGIREVLDRAKLFLPSANGAFHYAVAL